MRRRAPYVRYEFDLALPLASLLRRDSAGGVLAWFDPPANVFLCEMGRTAIRAAATLLDIGPGQEVLAPAYNCGSELDPLITAGATVRLYRVGADLAVDIDDLERRIGPATRAVYVTHYFGVPQPGIADLARLCRNRGIALIEDCAMALFSRCHGRAVGRFGDVSVFSLRKTLALLGGGALQVNRFDLLQRCRRDPPFPRPARRAPILRHGARALLAALVGDETAARVIDAGVRPYLMPHESIREPTGGAAAGIPRSSRFMDEMVGRRIDPISERALGGFAVQDVVATRRANHARLLARLDGVRGLSVLVPELPAGACPSCLAVRVANRDRFLATVRRKGVTLFQQWGYFHPEVDWSEMDESRALKSAGISLPIHQALGAREIDHMADVIASACA